MVAIKHTFGLQENGRGAAETIFLAMMTSMSGFKFAVSFLFNSATEAMVTATRRAREVTVLSIL